MAGPSHLKGVQQRQTASKHAASDVVQGAEARAGSPSPEGSRISYGKITAVNFKTSQVKVTMFREKGKGGDLKVKGDSFLPLLTPLSEIHLLWGALRPGLACRIFWRGKDEPQQAIIEIIGDEETTNFLTQPIQTNEVATGAFKLLSGGMTA